MKRKWINGPEKREFACGREQKLQREGQGRPGWHAYCQDGQGSMAPPSLGIVLLTQLWGLGKVSLSWSLHP